MSMYHIRAALEAEEEEALKSIALEREERIHLAWDYAPIDLKVTRVSNTWQVISFEWEQNKTDQAHFQKEFYLPTGQIEQGLIWKVDCLAANVLLVRSDLNEKQLLQEVVLAFLPF